MSSKKPNLVVISSSEPGSASKKSERPWRKHLSKEHKEVLLQAKPFKRLSNLVDEENRWRRIGAVVGAIIGVLAAVLLIMSQEAQAGKPIPSGKPVEAAPHCAGIRPDPGLIVVNGHRRD